MALFPGALPAAGSSNPSDTLANAGHTSLHNTAADESRAIATKIGTGLSTSTNNTVLRGNGSGTSAWGQVVLTTDVSGVLPVANGGTAVTATTGTAGKLVYDTSPTIATPTITNPTITGATIANLTSVISLIYPVGCIYTETTGTNPATTFGFGTWIAYGQGQVLIGNGTSDATYTAGTTGGASTNTHFHWQTVGYDGANLFIENAGVGSGQTRVITIDRGASAFGHGSAASREDGTYTTTISTVPPYVVVYIWKRTA